MKLQSLHQLFIEELQDIYDAEHQILEALPKMEEKADSSQLKNAFRMHHQQTREQVARLDRIFDQMGDLDRKDKKCKGMAGLIKEGEELMKEKAEPEVRDAGLIASAQRVEHYEISAYGTARTYAQLLGHPDWAELLQQSLDEEKETDHKLNQIAERINIEAKAA